MVFGHGILTWGGGGGSGEVSSRRVVLGQVTDVNTGRGRLQERCP